MIIDINVLLRKPNLIQDLSGDWSGIIKSIPVHNKSVFLNEYAQFIDGVKSKLKSDLVAFVSINNYMLADDYKNEHKNELSALKQSRIIDVEDDMYGIKTYIMQGGTILNNEKYFPCNRVLLLPWNVKNNTVEITKNKFFIIDSI